MAQLDCAVRNCAYNDNCFCCKGDILVGGKHACCEDDTCCESFADERKENFTSALEHPSRTISIDCEAVQCIYNSDYKCAAPHVDIKGYGAGGYRETSCGTFTEK